MQHAAGDKFIQNYFETFRTGIVEEVIKLKRALKK
jgi:hypothetical protein